jgi:hypothetical protein
MKTLSAPMMEGRRDGTKGLTRAEHLIAGRYQSLGLGPGGSKSYLQPFRVVIERRLKSGNFLAEDRHFQGISFEPRWRLPIAMGKSVRNPSFHLSLPLPADWGTFSRDS